jgi:cell wall-associated NlpC family hydrolase
MVGCTQLPVAFNLGYSSAVKPASFFPITSIMRAIWIIFGVLLTAILVSAWLLRHPATPAAALPPTPSAMTALAVSERRPAPARSAPQPRADSIIRFALAQVGTPYTYAGISPATGFDCSGFVLYVFGHFGVPTPHATALLIDAGRPVPRAQAQPGDIVVFTGTAATSTTPGHAGIVISALGETPLRFVHASSAKRESGVKISQVEGTDYERRFMQIRRVLDGTTTTGGSAPLASRGATVAASAATSRPAGAVAPLALPPAKPVSVPRLPPPAPTMALRTVRSRRVATHQTVVATSHKSYSLRAVRKPAPTVHKKTKLKLKKRPVAKTHKR